MKTITQLLSAVVLSVLASTAAAQTISPNLVPAPNHWTTNGQSIAQSYAINQALSNAGAGVVVGGFNYGYQYNLGSSYTQCTAFNQDGSCSWTMNFNPQVNVNVNIRDNTNTQIYNINHTETGTNTGNRSRDFQQRFIDPRNISTLGNFNFTASTAGNSTIWGMYSHAVYTVDQCASNPQSSPSCPGYRTYYTFGDDTYAHVPLPFTFPFYGRSFTNSWMHSNGVVSFLDPMAPIEGAGYNPGAWAYCCGGPDLSQNTIGHGAQFNYMIAPFWTDLYPDQNSQFYTTKDSNWIKYHWDNVPDISNGQNRNTFNLELRPTGSITASYGTIMSQQQVTIGTIGDLRLGEKTHQFFGVPRSSGINNWNWHLDATQAADCSNPLSNQNCPGYAEAYLSQQCSINPLHSPQCPGYAAAFLTQQCSANPLYNVNCPGYATAYYNYQCSADPLYHTGCPGYENAYFSQQCSISSLYNEDCPGYATAYFNQQCGLNPLYNNQCPGYADAYYVQQCTANPLYDTGCTGYAAAYFTQQCTLDGLYDRTCPNYAEAFAKKNILNIGSTSPTPSAPVQTTVVITTSDPVASAAPVIADPVVNQAVTTTTTSASPSQPVAPVQLVPAPQPAAAPAAVAAAETKKEETKKDEAKKEETKTADSSSSDEKKEEAKSDSGSSTSTASASSSSDSKEKPTTTRQALAERRLEAARAKAVEDGKQLAGKMGEAASLEAQIQVQGVVVAAMGFVPGFDKYGQVKLPDVIGYRPFEIYKGQRNVDNPAGRRFLTGADARHQEMVDTQYAR